MKKIIIAILCIFIFCGCSYKSYIINSNIDEIKEKVKNNETFILYIGSENCSHCAEFKPKLEDVANEYKLKIYYVDISKLDSNQENELKKIANYSGTPTTAFIDEGEDLGTQTHIDGDVSIEKIRRSLKNIGYIK